MQNEHTLADHPAMLPDWDPVGNHSEVFADVHEHYHETDVEAEHKASISTAGLRVKIAQAGPVGTIPYQPDGAD